MRSAIGTVGGMVQEKGSRYRCSSWTVLHAQCISALSSGFPISQGNAEALDRWGGKTKHRMISYFLNNIFAKNYRNRIVYSKSKVGRFLRHGVDMVRKLGAVSLFRGELDLPSNIMSPRPRRTSLPSGILIHPAVWPQQTRAENWGLCSFGGGELGLHLKQCGQGRGLPPCHVSSWSVQPFDHNTPKLQTDRQTGRQTTL